MDFRERRRFVLFAQAVEDVEGGHQIEGRGPRTEAGNRRLRHTALAIPVGELEAAERHVEARRVAELAEHDEVGAGAAAAIQNAWVRPPGESRRPRAGANEAAQAFPPEMLLLDPVGGFEQTIHRVC